MSDYPEHDKLSKVKDESQTCGEFIEWLGNEKSIYLGNTREFDDVGERFTTIGIPPIQQLLAEFFDIDYDELMREKDQMLRDIRVNHDQRELDEAAAS